MVTSETPLLSIRGLTKSFGPKPGVFARGGHTVRALEDVSLDIPRGSTTGVVGESGSGKSTLGRCILRLTDPDHGTVTWFDGRSAVLQPAPSASESESESKSGSEGKKKGTETGFHHFHAHPHFELSRGLKHRATSINLTALAGQELRTFRRRMQVIFQDPYNSLNPARPVWQIVGEGLFVQAPDANVVGPDHPQAERRGIAPAPLRRTPAARTQGPALQSGGRCESIRERAAVMLESVGLTRDHLDRLPHEFSGGQRQRIAIARALIVEPEFLVCDEVTSALDTRTQAQVLDLLRELQARTGVTVLFISHDLHTVAAMSREVVVMRAGRIVERGAPAQIFAAPTEAYTRALVAAVPNPDPRQRTFRQSAHGARAAADQSR